MSEWVVGWVGGWVGAPVDGWVYKGVLPFLHRYFGFIIIALGGRSALPPIVGGWVGGHRCRPQKQMLKKLFFRNSEV